MTKSFMTAIAICLFACNTAEKEIPKEETSEKVAAPPSITNMSGYTPSYSASFAMGDARHAETVLAIYKSWDSGNLETQNSSFADSIELYLSDGTVIAGRRDSAMATIQKFRNMFSSVKSTVHAIFPVKSTDKNEDFVCIWATEVNINQKGKKDSVDLQETWRLDKDGKINLVYQYAKAIKPPKGK